MNEQCGACYAFYWPQRFGDEGLCSGCQSRRDRTAFVDEQDALAFVATLRYDASDLINELLLEARDRALAGIGVMV